MHHGGTGERSTQPKAQKANAGIPRCWDATGDPTLPHGIRSPFCPAWPAYNASPATSSQQAQLRAMIGRLVAAHETEGVHAGRLESMLRPRCAQRFCLRVQILSGHLYVVAPQSRPCSGGHHGLDNCSQYQRKRLDGLAMTGAGATGKWSPDWSPTSLQWHFVAGLNLSDCSAIVRPGDVNGPFTRLRLLTQLRLLEEAAREGGVADTELVLCAGETPLNAGGWCLPNRPQPCARASNCTPPDATD